MQLINLSDQPVVLALILVFRQDELKKEPIYCNYKHCYIYCQEKN